MADAYGSIVFQKSIDCEFDKVRLCSVLNRFSWFSGGEGGWNPVDDGNIFLADSRDSQYPTLFPIEITKYFISNNESIIEKSPSEMKDDDFENIDDTEYGTVDFHVLAGLISNYIYEGHIILAMICNMSLRYVCLQKLIVYSNGSAKRTSETIGPWVNKSEIYEEAIGINYEVKV